MRILIFFGSTIGLTLAAMSIAVADPTGWAAWRIGLAAWAPALLFGLLAVMMYDDLK